MPAIGTRPEKFTGVAPPWAAAHEATTRVQGGSRPHDPSPSYFTFLDKELHRQYSILMNRFMGTISEQDAAAMLRRCGIVPTTQRVLITRTLLSRCEHLSAEDIFRIVNAEDHQVSKATVYNTLGLLARKGLIREVIADPTRVFYDPNTSPHHHLYDQTTGELTDVDPGQVQVTGLPPLPEGAALEGVDVVFRIRRTS